MNDGGAIQFDDPTPGRGSKSTTRGRVLRVPLAAKEFARRRGRELCGLACIGIAVFMILALLSYDPADPSLNQATGLDVGNLMGAAGASFADLAIQLFALATALPILALVVWGGYLLSHRSIGAVAWRLAALPVSFALGVLALGLTQAARLGDVSAAAMEAGPSFGGALGVIAGTTIAGPLAQLQIPLWAAACTAGVVALGMLFFALPLTSGQWLGGSVHLVRAVRTGLGAALRIAIATLRFLVQGLRRPNRAAARRPAGGDSVQARDEYDEVTQVPAHAEVAPLDTKRVATPQPRLKTGRREKEGRQKKLDLPVPKDAPGIYQLPPLDILSEPDRIAGRADIDREALEQNARMLESVLDDFGVRGDIVQVRPGPVVTMYELEPAPGTKTSRVISLADDIARSMSAVSVRIAVVPGRNAIGIELPNSVREMVSLRELLASAEFEKSKGLALALGKNIGGEPIFADLARMPHLLIAGTTGSGKSVGVNAMIVSLLYRFTPEDCRFIMIDPKMLELSIYDGIPHLLAPVVTEPKKAVVALKWVVREMENRYQAMSKLGVRNIDGYNQALEQAREAGEILSRRVQTGFDRETGQPVFEEQTLDMTRLPRIVVIVDEMADLMLVAGKDVEAAIQRLAQMARAAGIHLIMATQRPSVDVVTGTIKANFPTRIAFQVTSKIDSRTILGEQGAEQLLGQGDMLNMAGGGRITRIHGGFVSDTEVTDLVAFLCHQGEPDYDEAITSDDDVAAGIPGFDPSGGGEIGGSGDALYDQALALIAREGKASTSFVQRHLQIGYNRAARIIEQMEKEGVVSQANHVGKREVLVSDHSEPDY